MKVRFTADSDTFALEKGKIYDVISIERGWYRIMTELDEDYLFPPDAFEIVERKVIFHNDVPIVENDKYILKALCEEDKADYMNLYRETSAFRNNLVNLQNDESKKWDESVWASLSEEDTLHVSLFQKSDGAYVGDIVLKKLSSNTPEIGIDVCQKYQRQGIAYECIPLFAKKILEYIEAEYFLVRIYSDNIPSRKLFKKLSATRIGEELSEFAKVLEQMKTKYIDLYESYLDSNPEIETIANERFIIRYRYLP